MSAAVVAQENRKQVARAQVRVHLPIEVARCMPATRTACACLERCARAMDRPVGKRLSFIDASSILASPQSACEFFIDNQTRETQ